MNSPPRTTPQAEAAQTEEVTLARPREGHGGCGRLLSAEHLLHTQLEGWGYRYKDSTVLSDGQCVGGGAARGKAQTLCFSGGGGAGPHHLFPTPARPLSRPPCHCPAPTTTEDRKPGGQRSLTFCPL